MLNLKMLSDGVGIKMLGVHEGRPVPPVYTTCRRGMKRFDRFFYVKSGVINFDLPDGGGLSAGAGDIVYLPCDCEYISHWDIMEGGFISMNFIVGGNPASKPLGDRIEIAAHDRSGKYLAWFERAEEIFMRSGFGYIYDCTAIFFGIIKQVAADSAADTLKQECDRVWNAVTYLRNNYQTDVSAEELAKLCGMSVSAFRREFRLRCGVSPVRYKNTLRMTKARELLRGGDCSVSEASRLVGCPDIYYFSRLYKREFGVPPSRDMISI